MIQFSINIKYIIIQNVLYDFFLIDIIIELLNK